MTQDGMPFVSPDGSLVIPRETYLAAVALSRWEIMREDEAPEDSGPRIDREKAEAIILTCEHFGMPQATYKEIDPWLNEIRQGLDRAED